MQESIWHGVPMLGIPFFLDQHQNMQKIIARGIGEKLNLQNITVAEMVHKVRSIITTTRYVKCIGPVKRCQNKKYHKFHKLWLGIEKAFENIP